MYSSGHSITNRQTPRRWQQLLVHFVLACSSSVFIALLLYLLSLSSFPFSFHAYSSLWHGSSISPLPPLFASCFHLLLLQWPQCIFDTKPCSFSFRVKLFWGQKCCGVQKIWGQKMLGIKTNYDRNCFCVPKFRGSQKMLGSQKCWGHLTLKQSIRNHPIGWDTIVNWPS